MESGVIKTNASSGNLKLTLDEFINTYCDMCGTQRCDPKDPIWREGCKHYRENKPFLNKEQNE